MSIPLITIYKLLDPNTSEVRYIGQTKNSLGVRFSGHLSKSKYLKRNHTHCWINSLDQRGLKPLIIEVCRIRSEYADEMEIRLIQFYRSLGYSLTNHDDGGIGKGRIVSEETRAKISSLKTGQPRPDIVGQNNPSKRSEVRLKIRAAKIGVPKSVEHRHSLSVAHKGRKKPVEFGRVMSERQSRFWELYSPNGEVFIVKNLKKFCEENELNSGAMCSVAKGRLRQHKGWKVKSLYK